MGLRLTRLKLLLLLERVPLGARGGVFENEGDFENEQKNIENSDDDENLEGSLSTEREEEGINLSRSRSLHRGFEFAEKVKSQIEVFELLAFYLRGKVTKNDRFVKLKVVMKLEKF